MGDDWFVENLPVALVLVVGASSWKPTQSGRRLVEGRTRVLAEPEHSLRVRAIKSSRLRPDVKHLRAGV